MFPRRMKRGRSLKQRRDKRRSLQSPKEIARRKRRRLMGRKKRAIGRRINLPIRTRRKRRRRKKRRKKKERTRKARTNDFLSESLFILKFIHRVLLASIFCLSSIFPYSFSFKSSCKSILELVLGTLAK